MIKIHNDTGCDDIDHLVAALEAGEGEGRLPVGLNLGVDVGGHVEQQLDDRGVPVHDGQHQGTTESTLAPLPRPTILDTLKMCKSRMSPRQQGPGR